MRHLTLLGVDGVFSKVVLAGRAGESRSGHSSAAAKASCQVIPSSIFMRNCMT